MDTCLNMKVERGNTSLTPFWTLHIARSGTEELCSYLILSSYRGRTGYSPTQCPIIVLFPSQHDHRHRRREES